MFKELPTKNKDSVIRSYQHIDNGGHTIELDIHGNLTIGTGFYGYSETAIMLGKIDLDGLIETLLLGKQRLSELESIRILKGE
jgi:hypothetical protein